MSEQSPESGSDPASGIESDGTPLMSDEFVARAIVASRWFNKQTLSLKAEAFEPPPDGNLSVTRHVGIEVAELWAMCRNALQNQIGRSLHGRADVRVESVRASGSTMSVIAAARAHNANHAHVVGWPADRAARLEIQQVIAAASSFVAAPQER